MNNVINLNQFRKKQKRAEREEKADENRVKYGRRKGDIALDEAEKKKQQDFLDGHQGDDEDA